MTVARRKTSNARPNCCKHLNSLVNLNLESYHVLHIHLIKYSNWHRQIFMRHKEKNHEGKQQLVTIHKATSGMFDIANGVPQGSELGQFLF